MSTMARSRCVNLQQFLLLLCMLVSMNFNGVYGDEGEQVHTKTFSSPGFTLGPGDVIDRYLQVDMPRGHIAVRSFDMNLVDSDGTPVPLSDTYLHHWVLIRYYLEPAATDKVDILTPFVPNAGVCNPFLVQYFGLGSEFRHTNIAIQAPYGIVVGNPADVPTGQEEYWYLNVHAIDTRGADSTTDCTECRCDVYNVTIDGYGRPLPLGYEGGILCCHDRTHCPTRKGFQGERRELFLEFNIKYVDYSDAVVPAKVYLLDVTDRRTAWDEPAQCGVEFTVPKCAAGSAKCLFTQEANAFLPTGGHVVFSIAHLHSGGVSASLSLESGEDVCVSTPIYGQGKEAGNETGYVVGMTVCYPDERKIYIRAREKLSVRAVYDNNEKHFGVMGIFLLIVAEGEPQTFSLVRPPGFSLNMSLATLAIAAVAVIGGVAWYQGRMKRRLGAKYKPIV